MTVPELIEALQRLPGDNDLRIVFVRTGDPSNAKKNRDGFPEARVQAVVVGIDGVYLQAYGGKF